MVPTQSVKLYDGLNTNVEKLYIIPDLEPSANINNRLQSGNVCSEYQCLVTGLAPRHQCLFYPFFFLSKPINSLKLECVRSREDENYL